MVLTAAPPRGPKNPPIVGNLYAFRSNPLRFLSKVAREYGDVVYFRVARQHMYLVNHPDYVREILVNNQGNFLKSRALQRSKVLLGEGLLTSEGQLHLRQRRLVQPAFHRERLAGYASAMSGRRCGVRERWQAGSTMDISTRDAAIDAVGGGENFVQRRRGIGSIRNRRGDDRGAPDVPLAVDAIFRLLVQAAAAFRTPLSEGPGAAGSTIYGLIRERRNSGVDTGDLLSMLLFAQDESRTEGKKTAAA